jgi:histidinol-phosphatase (PHP family)
MIKADLHTHICKSNISDMIKGGKKAGLEWLGIAEHSYQFFEGRDGFNSGYVEGRIYSFDEYEELFLKAGTGQNSKMRLLKGVEIDFLEDGYTRRFMDRIHNKQIDYIIGSLHELDGYDIHMKLSLSPSESENRWKRYILGQIDGLKTYSIDILAHPVRMAATVPFVRDEILQDLLSSLVYEAKVHDIMIEINAKDSVFSEKKAGFLIDACAALNNPVTFGSDAHNPLSVGNCFDKIRSMLLQRGIDRYYIFSNRKRKAVIL